MVLQKEFKFTLRCGFFFIYLNLANELNAKTAFMGLNSAHLNVCDRENSFFEHRSIGRIWREYAPKNFKKRDVIILVHVVYFFLLLLYELYFS